MADVGRSHRNIPTGDGYVAPALGNPRRYSTTISIYVDRWEFVPDTVAIERFSFSCSTIRLRQLFHSLASCSFVRVTKKIRGSHRGGPWTDLHESVE